MPPPKLFNPDQGVAADPGQKVVMTPTVQASVSSTAPNRLDTMYDKKNHRWNAAYVFPGKYRLRLRLTRFEPTVAKPLHWRVVSLDKKFATITRTLTQPAPASGFLIDIPTTGRVRIEARMGTSKTPVVREVNVRDCLIASIGDSFSSGQGNPDVEGVPSDGSRAICDATTLRKIVAELHAELRGVPVLGDVTKLVEEVGDFVKDTACEVGGWFGFDCDTVSLEPKAPPKWLEPKAWRSLKSAPALAAKAVVDANAGRLVTFVSVASSGATINSGLLKPQRSFQKVGQIDELVQLLRDPRDHRDNPQFLRPIDVLVMSIGGNDVGFAGTLSDMTKNVNLVGKLGTIGASNADTERAVRKEIAKLPAKYDKLATIIRERLRPKAVVVLEYPSPLFDGNDGQPTSGCGLFRADAAVSTSAMAIDKSEAKLIEQLGNELNAVVRAAASRHGWFMVDGVASRFKRHGYCSSDSWFVFAEDSCNRQGDLEGTLHPNAAGTKTVARLLTSEIKGILNQTDNDSGGGLLA